jgi:hypothetical protein
LGTNSSRKTPPFSTLTQTQHLEVTQASAVLPVPFQEVAISSWRARIAHVAICTMPINTVFQKKGPSGFSAGEPLIPAPPTEADLPFVCTSHRSTALTSDRWQAPTKAEKPHSLATIRLRSPK